MKLKHCHIRHFSPLPRPLLSFLLEPSKHFCQISQFNPSSTAKGDKNSKIKNELENSITFETPFGEVKAANIAEVSRKDPRLEEYEEMSEKVSFLPYSLQATDSIFSFLPDKS